MTQGFDDIVIDDLDLRKTTWSRVHSSMRTLYLKLSREPDLAWIRFFHEERESRIVLKRHGLWIEDGYIVFDCVLADVERHHLPDFRLSVSYANEKCRELEQRRIDENREAREVSLAEQRQLAELRSRVRGSRDDDAQAATDLATRSERAPEATAAQTEASLAVALPESRQPPVTEHAPSVSSEPNEPPQSGAAPAEPRVPEPPAPHANGSGAEAIDFNSKRDEWRARFRAAMAAQNKETDRADK